MKGNPLESSLDSNFVFGFDGFFIEGVGKVVRKNTPSSGWYNGVIVAGMDGGVAIGVKEVDNCFCEGVFPGHVVKNDSIIVWMEGLKLIDLPDEKGVLEMRKSILCFSNA